MSRQEKVNWIAKACRDLNLVWNSPGVVDRIEFILKRAYPSMSRAARKDYVRSVIDTLRIPINSTAGSSGGEKDV